MLNDKPDEIIAIFQKATSFARELMYENERLRKKLGEVEAQTSRFAERYGQVEEQTELLRNLFVATHRLHATLEPEEVVTTLRDIMTDLIGAERFVIWMADATGQLKAQIHAGVGDGSNLKLSAIELE